MKFENIVIEIKRIHGILTNKDSEVFIVYKGKRHGITKPWNIKIDTKEANGETEIKAALELLSSVSIDVHKKIDQLKSEILALEKAINQVQDYKEDDNVRLESTSSKDRKSSSAS